MVMIYDFFKNYIVIQDETWISHNIPKNDESFQISNRTKKILTHSPTQEIMATVSKTGKAVYKAQAGNPNLPMQPNHKWVCLLHDNLQPQLI